jgi:hypothetical protein
LYGEDGLDVCKSQYLKEKQFSFLEDALKSVEGDKTFKMSKKLGKREDIDIEKQKVWNFKAPIIIEKILFYKINIFFADFRLGINKWK